MAGLSASPTMIKHPLSPVRPQPNLTCTDPLVQNCNVKSKKIFDISTQYEEADNEKVRIDTCDLDEYGCDAMEDCHALTCGSKTRDRDIYLLPLEKMFIS